MPTCFEDTYLYPSATGDLMVVSEPTMDVTSMSE